MNECVAKETTQIIVIGTKFNKLFGHLWNKSVPLMFLRMKTIRKLAWRGS